MASKKSSRSRIPKSPAAVTQQDLEELIYLRRLLEEAHEKWVAKCMEIRAALTVGARTEPGVHLVGMVTLGGYPRMVVK